MRKVNIIKNDNSGGFVVTKRGVKRGKEGPSANFFSKVWGNSKKLQEQTRDTGLIRGGGVQKVTRRGWGHKKPKRQNQRASLNKRKGRGKM